MENKLILSDINPKLDSTLNLVGDGEKSVVAEMSIDEWLSIPNHPLFRPAGQRLARDSRGSYVTTSTFIADPTQPLLAAELNGRLFRVTGHEETLAWEVGADPMPGTVFVRFLAVNSRQALNKLYVANNELDSVSQYDKVVDAYEVADLVLESKRLRYGYVLNALNIALRGVPRAQQDKRLQPPIDIYRAVAVFREELLQLDSVDPQPDVFYNGVVAAALIALSIEREKTLEFLSRLSAKQGTKVDGRSDPVETCLESIAHLKTKRSAWIGAAQQDLCGRVLRAWTAWQKYKPEDDKYWFRSRVRSMNFQPLIAKFKKGKAVEKNIYL